MFSKYKHYQRLTVLIAMFVASILVSLLANIWLIQGKFEFNKFFWMTLIAFLSSLIVWVPFKRGIINIVLEVVFCIVIWTVITLGVPRGNPDAEWVYWLTAELAIFWSLVCFAVACVVMFLSKLITRRYDKKTLAKATDEKDDTSIFSEPTAEVTVEASSSPRSKWRKRLLAAAIFLYALSFFLPSEWGGKFFGGLLIVSLIFSGLLISILEPGQGDPLLMLFLNMANVSMILTTLAFYRQKTVKPVYYILGIVGIASSSFGLFYRDIYVAPAYEFLPYWVWYVSQILAYIAIFFPRLRKKL